ncbi:MAG: hypothetical protein ACT4NP_05365 [Pseudonocardiales bacterium]
MTTRAPAPPPLDDQLESLLRRMRLPHIRRVVPRHPYSAPRLGLARLQKLARPADIS